MSREVRQPGHPDLSTVGLVDVMTALSDPTRLAIVAMLARTGEQAWGELDLPCSKSTLSHHTKVLREAGVIRHRKDGVRCWVGLRPDLEDAFPGLLASVIALAAGDRQVAALIEAKADAA